MLLCVIFVASGIEKLVDAGSARAATAATLTRIGLDASLTVPVVWSVASWELGLALFLLLPKLRRTGFLLSAATLVLFAVLVPSSGPVSCGCGPIAGWLTQAGVDVRPEVRSLALAAVSVGGLVTLSYASKGGTRGRTLNLGDSRLGD